MSGELRPVDVVLGGLDAPQTAEAERRLREDPAFRAAVTRLQQTADAVRDAAALGAVPVPPPLDLDAALAARPAWDAVPAGQPTVPTVVERPRRTAWRERLAGRLAGPFVVRPLAAGLAGAVLLVAGVGGGLLVAGDGDGPAPTPTAAPDPIAALPAVPLSAFAGFDGTTARVAVHLPDRAGEEGDLIADGLAPSPSGHYYELWLMTDDEHLASLGSFRVGPDGHAHIRFALAADPKAYRYLDVSVEPDDGDPAHSSKSVLRSAPLA